MADNSQPPKTQPGSETPTPQEAPATFSQDAQMIAEGLHQASHVLGGVAGEKRGYSGATLNCLLAAASARALAMACICGAKKGEERFIFDRTLELARNVFDEEMALRDEMRKGGAYVSSEVGHA